MQKRHERVPMDKKLKALKVCFFKIIHENYKLNLSFLLLLCLVIQGKDVVCLIYNISTCNFNLGVIRIYMFEILKKFRCSDIWYSW